MKKYLFGLVLLASSNCVLAEKIADQVKSVSQDDTNMNLAIAQARKTLDDFLVLSKKPPKGASNFRLKVKLSDENGVEHFWFLPFKEIEGGFAGVLANDPEVIKSVVAGNVYAFKREQITDWGYELNGKQIGSFTVCVLFKTMTKDEVKRYKQDYGYDCK